MGDPILSMQPGPTIVDDRVIQSLASPVMHHLSPEFIEILEETCSVLKTIYGTTGEVVVLPSSGRGAVEASLTSIREEDRPLVVPVNGTFSRMMANIGKSLGMEVVVLPYDDGQVLPKHEIISELRKYNRPIFGMVHNDTSTGMVNDLGDYGDAVHKLGGLYLVDAVSSLGGTDIAMDQNGIDLCASASQKALGSLPGLGTVAMSARAKEALDARSDLPRGSYLDLQKWWNLWVRVEDGGRLASGYRRLPWSMPTHLVVALHRSCQLIQQEGIEEIFARHARAAKALRAALKALDLELPVGDAEASTTMTQLTSEKFELADVRQQLLRRHNIRVAGNLDTPSDSSMRIAHMAETARSGPLIQTLSALAEVIYSETEVPTDPVRKFYEVWNQTA